MNQDNNHCNRDPLNFCVEFVKAVVDCNCTKACPSDYTCHSRIAKYGYDCNNAPDKNRWFCFCQHDLRYNLPITGSHRLGRLYYALIYFKNRSFYKPCNKRCSGNNKGHNSCCYSYGSTSYYLREWTYRNKQNQKWHSPKNVYNGPQNKIQYWSWPYTVFLSSAYLAPIEYYTKLLAYDKVFIEQHDHYMKQTYRNRCTIAVPDGELALSIPTVKPNTLKCPMRDIRISDHGNWRHLHWNAIESAYNHTPFFEYYKDDFRPFYEKKYEFLVDFNEELCHLICSLIDIQPDMARTTEYRTEFTPNEADFRERIHPKKDFSLEDTEFSPQPYYQVFQERLGFLPNLSIIDLLFNMGPESLLVLQKSITLK